MRKHLTAIVCAVLIIGGIFVMVCLGVNSFKQPPASDPVVEGSSTDKYITERTLSCDKWCKEERHLDFGKLKTSPDGENLICLCYKNKKRSNTKSI